jgi:hypothetical protein
VDGGVALAACLAWRETLLVYFYGFGRRLPHSRARQRKKTGRRQSSREIKPETFHWTPSLKTASKEANRRENRWRMDGLSKQATALVNPNRLFPAVLQLSSFKIECLWSQKDAP